MSNTMRAQDAINGKLGRCFVTIDGERKEFLQLIKVEARVEKVKTEVPILGQPLKGNKTIGLKGSGSATIHYGYTEFKKLISKFANEGKDLYFDMQIENEDPTSDLGRQVVILRDCNFDSATIASINTDEDDILKDEIDFTFESFKFAEHFKQI